MKKHPVTVEGFDGSLQELAQKILRMRYDKAEEFFSYCVAELERQADGDRKRERPMLATRLELASETARQLTREMQDIFLLCAPHMQDELG